MSAALAAVGLDAAQSCPTCGNPPKMADGGTYMYVICDKMKCCRSTSRHMVIANALDTEGVPWEDARNHTVQKAIEEWNRRCAHSLSVIGNPNHTATDFRHAWDDPTKAARLPSYPSAPGSKREGPSSEAARALKLPKVHEIHRRICALLEQHAMTPDEISASLGLKPAYGRPRCSELVALGLIEETGERRRNPGSRMSAGVYRRTPQPMPATAKEEQG